MSDQPVRSWTVLLLYPDYLADNYGQETYLTWVNATSAADAEKFAREEAAQANNYEPDDAENFAVLFVTLGTHPNLMEID